MKAKLLMISMVALAAAAFTACDSDDDNEVTNINPAFTTALQTKYPETKNLKVEWENKGNYKVAEYTYQLKDIDVWFNAQAQWVMTGTDLGKDLFMIADNGVNEAFANSPYSTWTLDDIDFYERQSDSFYTIEVEQGNQEATLFYNRQGNLLQIVNGDIPDITPDYVIAQGV